MYEEFVSLLEAARLDPDLSAKDAFIQLAGKYGVCEKTVYNRFRSYFGMTFTDKLRESLVPTKEALTSMILSTETVQEVWDQLLRPYHYYNGIFDRYYGVSTYQKAKVKLLSEAAVTSYKVSRTDNRALIYSQLLGDGSYDSRRHALRICHGIKQADYLRWKVGMLCKGYPQLNPQVKVRTHAQGHQYVEWYSGHLGNVDIPEKEDYSSLISELTPLGWLLWWLDDGHWAQNVSIATIRADLQTRAIEVLATYGVKARRAKNEIIMCGQANDMQFVNNFIRPFLDVIPPCVRYKVKI